MKRVKAMCVTCPWLCVETKDSRDWSVFICNRERAFVDVYSPIDTFHPDLWRAAAAYFEGLDTADMTLPGGRYSCAKTLASRSLSFLAGLSLGQISHVVQLAISQKRILGYLNGAVVPYGRSQSKIKDDAAKHGAQVGSASGLKLADWNLLLHGMKEILANSSTAEHLSLSTIKRIFRSRFQAELSETALGHAKLSNLMQDPRLQSICTVDLHGNCYVVTKLETQAGAIRGQTHDAVPHRQLMPLASVQSEAQAPVGQTPLVSKAVAGAHAIAALLQESQGTSDQHPSAPEKRSVNSVSARAPWIKPLDTLEDEPALETSMPLMTPTPSAFGITQHWNRNSVLDAHMWETNCKAIGLVPPSQHLEQQNLRSVPSHGSNATIATESFQGTVSGSDDEHLTTPGVLEQNGYSVLNTFIHAQAVPPTPSLSAAATRSHSLPRNMGLANGAEKCVAVAEGKLAAHDATRRMPGNRLMSAAAAAATAAAVNN